jgi:hypothetical protein
MRFPIVVLAALVSASSAVALAQDESEDDLEVKVGGVAEVRYAHTGDTESWLDGGLGKTRYGAKEGHAADLFSVPLVALVVDAAYQDVVTAHVHLDADAEPEAALERGRVGLVEAYVGYRNDLSRLFRLRVRGGLFFPPISLEHPGPAWTTVYTITPSAVNSWVGEEVRTAGVEARIGMVSGENELWLTGAGFGWNDPTGTLLAWRGWALHDRQTLTGEKLPLPPISAIGPGNLFGRQAPWDAPIREIDGRLGFYGGAALRAAGRLEVDALYYDNRGDPTAFDGYQWAWETRFWNAGARLRLPAGFEVLGQFMSGETSTALRPSGVLWADVDYEAWYALGSFSHGPVRASVRYDDFSAVDRDLFKAQDDNDETGHAWTAALMVSAGRHLLLMAEWMRVDSDRPFRTDLDLPVHAREDLVQVGARVSF